KIDSIARDLGYTSRSDFIRDAILEYLRFLKQNDNNRNTG
ncbi:CopG family transcriptional regulator, partial [Sulfolobus sp. E1]